MGFASSGLRFGFRTKGPGMLRIPSFAAGSFFFFFCGGGGGGGGGGADVQSWLCSVLELQGWPFERGCWEYSNIAIQGL